MLSDASIEKIGWVKNMWQRWIKSKAETNDTILQCDIVSLFRNFRGAASDYLCDFFEKIRKEDGNPYSPRTLSHIMAVMCMLLKDEGINVNLFENREFLNVQKTLDRKMKTLAADGYQPPVRKAKVITNEMERELWENGVLGYSNPTQLLQTVYYINGTHFCLRARGEHRNLRVGAQSQLRILGMGNNERIEYKEDLSKNNTAGIKHKNVRQKTGVIYATQTEFCPVKIVKKYISLLPKNAPAFYCKPKTAYGNTGPWYTRSPVGVNVLCKIVQKIAEQANWDQTEIWSGHSLRASSINTLQEEGMPDAVVKMASGHRSDMALHEYVRSDTLKRKMSDIISGASTSAAGSGGHKRSSQIVTTVETGDDFDNDDTLEQGMLQLANEEDQNEQQSKIVNSIKFENSANVTITFK